MNCLRARQEMKAMIDGELRLWTRWLVTCHITSCESCRREMEEMTELTNDVQNAATVTAPQGLRDKVLGELSFEPTGQASRPAWRKYARLAGTLCAMLLVAAVLYPVFVPARERARIVPRSALTPETQKALVSHDYDASMPHGAANPSANYDSVDGPPVTGRDLAKSKVAASVPDARLEASINLMIIKTADISVQVRDFQQANDEAVSIARSVGGYVTDTSAQSDTGVSTSGCLTMRVPVNSFERALGRIAKLGKVTSRSISGEDVTGESVDLESRLRNLRAEERQYLEIMNRAKRIPDVVTVTNELSRVRGEIEEAQGRLKYLKSAAAMSTINLTVSENQKSRPHRSAIGTTFGNAIGSLGATLSGLADIVIWLLVYSPFWALPIALWFYYRRRVVPVQQ